MSLLVIPVHLDVLLVRQSGGKFAACAMREPTRDDERHRDLWPEPFSELDGGRPRGAYLHWALPDALTHATVGDDGSASFCAIPDRWLVVRLSPSTTPGKRATRSWVIESDRGIVVPLEEWSETQRAPIGNEPLTALGHGDVAWAAYFDNTVNRLAFHDDLSSVTAGPISYFVSGWVASSSLDPIADPALGTKAATLARMAELKWKQTGARVKAVESERPRGAMYHGAVVDLAWPTPSATSPEVGGPPNPATIKVVVAGTMCEALATLLASSPAEVRMLEALQLGALDELAQPDGRTRLDSILHANEFGSLPGGEVIEHVRQPLVADDPRPPVPPIRESVVAPETLVRKFALADRVRETVDIGRLSDVRLQVRNPESPPPATGLVEVHRSLPRFFHPTDPVVLVQGGHRSFKHGGDGRFAKDGMLLCRASGDAVHEIAVRDPRTERRLVVQGAQLLEKPLRHPHLPRECEELLHELVLLDPGSASAVANTALARERSSTGTSAHLQRRIEVEQTAWWLGRDTRVHPGMIASHSGLTGTLPSPVAVNPPIKPWTPLHLEWEAEYIPSAAGPRGWQLEEIDYERSPDDSADVPSVFRGRTLLTPGVANAASAAARRSVQRAIRIGSGTNLEPDVIARFQSDVAEALHEHLDQIVVEGDVETDLGDALAQLDVLSGTFEPLHAHLRGGVAFDEPAPASEPTGPVVAMRAGMLHIRRLRLVDCFGQFVDLSPTVVLGETLRIQDVPDRIALPPRLTAPARLWLRYVDGAGSDAVAGTTVTPVAGFLLPNHVDGALEIFDANGTSRGALREGLGGGVVFEAAPGIASPLGLRPRDVLENPALVGIVEGLLDWAMREDAESESVLSALLRIVDTSRWSVDPQGHGVDDDLGPLVGRPIVVMMAHAWLEIAEQDQPELALLELPLRLGSLGSFQDGLHGAFVDGDYRTLHVAGAAAAFAREVGPGRGYLQQVTALPVFHAHFAADLEDSDGMSPIVHPYVARDQPAPLRVGKPTKLTLLMEPYGVIQATTGLLPRKEIGMRREWLATALARIAPTFRFGPVLVDPKRVRLPVPREANGGWTWAHRIDEASWEEAPVVDVAGQTVAVGATITASEGWLRFTPSDEEP